MMIHQPEYDRRNELPYNMYPTTTSNIEILIGLEQPEGPSMANYRDLEFIKEGVSLESRRGRVRGK